MKKTFLITSLCFVTVFSFHTIAKAQTTACVGGSATNVTTDACYEEYCTGQSTEDSTSCNTYATNIVNRDDGGDTTCVSINKTNENSCCPPNISDLSPMCMAYNNYTSADANAESGVAAGQSPVVANTVLPNNIVSPAGDGLIPCDGPDCTFNSVMQLLNNVTNFFFSVLLFPIFVVMVMYLGYTYLTAGGNSGQHAKLANMAKHMVLGLLLMLCAWLIVHTILSALGYVDTLGFFGK